MTLLETPWYLRPHDPTARDAFETVRRLAWLETSVAEILAALDREPAWDALIRGWHADAQRQQQRLRQLERVLSAGDDVDLPATPKPRPSEASTIECLVALAERETEAYRAALEGLVAPEVVRRVLRDGLREAETRRARLEDGVTHLAEAGTRALSAGSPSGRLD
ncbi:MAG: hypothetical protein R3B72_24970 [Polyangiaceae bacterium]